MIFFHLNIHTVNFVSSNTYVVFLSCSGFTIHVPLNDVNVLVCCKRCFRLHFCVADFDGTWRNKLTCFVESKCLIKTMSTANSRIMVQIVSQSPRYHNNFQHLSISLRVKECDVLWLYVHLHHRNKFGRQMEPPLPRRSQGTEQRACDWLIWRISFSIHHNALILRVWSSHWVQYSHTGDCCCIRI